MNEPAFERPWSPSAADFAVAPPLQAQDDELALLANSSMRVRRAPRALLWMWAFQGVLAALAAWPFTALVGGAYGSHPRGDAPMWRPGGLSLLDFLEANSRLLRSLTPLPIVALAATVVLGLIPLALLLAQMTFATRSRKSARFGQLMPVALSAFGPMLALLAVVSVAQGAIVALGFGAGALASSGLADRLGEARAAQVGGLVVAAFAVVASGLGVVQDLARASIVRFQVGMRQSIFLAANTFGRGPVLLFASWALRATGMAALVILGSVVSERTTGTPRSLFLIPALHQAIVLSRLALRASWLAHALRAVDIAHRVVRTGATLPTPLPVATTSDPKRRVPPLA